MVRVELPVFDSMGGPIGLDEGQDPVTRFYAGAHLVEKERSRGFM